MLSRVGFFQRGIFIFGMALFLAACAEAEQSPNCELESILLSVDDLPTGTMVSSIARIDPDSTTNSRVINFYIPEADMLLSHAVYWYPEEKYAIRKYDKEKISATTEDLTGQVFKQPSEVDLSGLIANEYAVGCGQLVNGYRCILTARYGNYVTRLNSNIDLDGQTISFDGFKRLAFRVDELFSKCASR